MTSFDLVKFDYTLGPITQSSTGAFYLLVLKPNGSVIVFVPLTLMLLDSAGEKQS